MARDPGNWHGVFYFNRKDYRIMVPKIYPMTGWTVNFGNPYSWLALAGFIIIMVIFSIFLN
ncbi:MAG: hypothetical protein H6538_08575 [Bacteroidales bacterium]|nr:hypothetical protein [Bacteroidales bacterium]MCB9013841.1 hypothetical protein [Bacteroidales bacterium]